MKPKLSLRWRLTIWYSTIVLISLIAFAFFAYYWVFYELYSNLDESLKKISYTLGNIIEEEEENTDSGAEKNNLSFVFSGGTDKFTIFKKEVQSRFIGPVRPSNKEIVNQKSDVVWSAIFTHLLLNPDNYYIQIADTNQQIVWKSRNLEAYEMPVDMTYQSAKKTKIYTKYSFYDNVMIGQEQLRLFVNRNDYSIITIAYTVRDVQDTLRDLFSAILLAVPVILFVSITGGVALAKMSLKPVDKMTKTANDITARNLSLRIEEPDTDDEIARLARTLNDMILRLQQSFIRIQQFTSDASHELRTPLTILRGEIEIALSKERSEDDYIEVLGSALDEVLRLSNVVESLLQLSRADSGHSKLSFARGNLSVLIESITEDITIIAETKNIEISSDIQKGVIAQFDDGKIHQAVLNILDNAVKYTPEKGGVRISLKDREHYVEIKVSDNGLGMTQEELGHIFDRFYRVDKARSSENIKGSGLGLSIVKWIVESHNGKIFVESQPKKGTNFIMMLPKNQNI